MTTKADWEFRAEHLEDQARYLERKAGEIMDEARRYRGLAEQARALIRIGDNDGWQTIDSAPKNRPIQVINDDPDHPWLPLTAYLIDSLWNRPACRDDLPFTPTHWRELPMMSRRIPHAK